MIMLHSDLKSHKTEVQLNTHVHFSESFYFRVTKHPHGTAVWCVSSWNKNKWCNKRKAIVHTDVTVLKEEENKLILLDIKDQYLAKATSKSEYKHQRDYRKTSRVQTLVLQYWFLHRQKEQLSKKHSGTKLNILLCVPKLVNLHSLIRIHMNLLLSDLKWLLLSSGVSSGLQDKNSVHSVKLVCWFCDSIDIHLLCVFPECSGYNTEHRKHVVFHLRQRLPASLCVYKCISVGYIDWYWIINWTYNYY